MKKTWKVVKVLSKKYLLPKTEEDKWYLVIMGIVVAIAIVWYLKDNGWKIKSAAEPLMLLAILFPLYIYITTRGMTRKTVQELR